MPTDADRLKDRLRAARYRAKHGNHRIKEWKAENPDRIFISSMKKQGIDCTWEKLQQMLEQQGGVCAICHKPETTMRQGQPIQMSVDHNHATGQVRGLLCQKCNHAIGLFDDDLALLRNAIFYLETNRCR